MESSGVVEFIVWEPVYLQVTIAVGIGFNKRLWTSMPSAFILLVT